MQTPQQRQQKQKLNKESKKNFFFNCFQGQQEEITCSQIENESSPEFLIKDMDTNEVYDIRQIDQNNNQKFSYKNNTDYMKKLKKRQDHQWKDWWGTKRENNIKLLHATKINNQEQIRQVLENVPSDLRADVNFRDSNDWSSLHYACLNGTQEIVLILIQNEADIDLQNNMGQTSLIIATQKGFVNILQQLLNAGADINHQDMNFNTALHYACLFDKREVIEILLNRASIQTNLKNCDQKTAFDLITNNSTRLFIQEVRQRRQFLKEQNQQQVTIVDATNESVLQLFSDRDGPNNQFQYQQGQKAYQYNQYSSSNQYPTQRQGTPFQSSQISTALSSPKRKLNPDRFQIINLIGRGSFGEVYLVQEKDSKNQYAMKVLHKNKVLGQNLVKYALTERNVLSISNHPYIIKLKYAFQNEKILFLIMEYAVNGDMQRLLMTEKKLSEERARLYISQILLALEHLHVNDIIYRDLKPENIVFDYQGNAMLTDFGLSKEGIGAGDTTVSFLGSLAYLAPEMIKRSGHNKSVDWYHLGILLYEMLMGKTPFLSNNKQDIINNIEQGKISFGNNEISNTAQDLILQLMHKNPNKRLGGGLEDAQEIKKHKFFEKIDWQALFNRQVTMPKFKKQPQMQHNPFSVPQNLDLQNSKNFSVSNYIKGWSFIGVGDF